MRPVLYMVTDRRRAGADWRPALAERIGAVARAGIHIIQIRERDLDGRTLTQVVEDAIRAVVGTAARIVVNDRVDVALAAGAHGVHLRADSMPASRIRGIAAQSARPMPSVESIMQRIDELSRRNYLHRCSWKELAGTLRGVLDDPATRCVFSV